MKKPFTATLVGKVVLLTGVFFLAQLLCTAALILSSEQVVGQFLPRKDVTSLLSRIFPVLLATCFIPIVPVALLLYYVRTSAAQKLRLLSENSTRAAAGLPLINSGKKGDLEFEFIEANIQKLSDDLAAARSKSKVSQPDLEKRLSVSEERIRRLLTSMPVGLAVTTDQGMIESVNPRLEELFLSDASELAGKALYAVLGASDNGRECDYFELETLENGQKLEFDITRRDRTILPVEVTANRLPSPEGSRWLVSVYDISERREIDRMKQEVVAMITHDLRTPLATITNFLEMLEMKMFGSINEKGQRMLVLAERNSSRMLNLINDLLDIEKVKSNMLQLQLAPIPLQRILDQASEPMSGWAADRGVIIHVDPTDIIVMADEDRLVRVVTNLLSNSVKFSPRDSTITIASSKAEGLAQVTVKDQGRGIPEDKLQGIFDRFTQVQSSDATMKGGSGLGLAICKAFVELHGGTIAVTSEIDVGTTFSFTIPVATD